MVDSTLFSIELARKQKLGGISRDTIYGLLRTRKLASVVIGRRRFISQGATDSYVALSTTRVSPAAGEAGTALAPRSAK